MTNTSTSPPASDHSVTMKSRLKAYLRTVRLLYNECLIERTQFKREHVYDGQKHKFSRKSVSHRAKVIYQRENATITGQDPNSEKQTC
jgi:hypothetical protein